MGPRAPPTAASPDPFRTADILSVFHTSLRPQQPSRSERRGAGLGPELQTRGSRVEVGNRRCPRACPHLRACAGGSLAGGVPCTSPCCLFLGQVGLVAHPPDGEGNGHLTFLWTSSNICCTSLLGKSF